ELRVFGKLRMTAREHHPQLLVANDAGLECLVNRGAERPLTREMPGELGCERERRALTPHPIERAVLRRRHQPRRRVLRYAADFPHLERAAKGILRNVLGERQIVHAEDSRKRGDEPARLTPEEVRGELHGQSCSFMIGRTSTLPEPRRTGQPRASSTASAWS